MKKLTTETRWHLIDAVTGIIRAKRGNKLIRNGDRYVESDSERAHADRRRRLRGDRHVRR